MNQSKKLTEGAILSAIFLALMLVTFIPILSLFATFLLPIPFVMYSSRHGMKAAGVMLMAVSILTVLFFTIFSLPFTLLMGIGGILIGHAIFKQRSAYETLGYGTLGFIGGMLFTVAFLQVLFGVNLIQEFETISTEQMQGYISFMEGLNIANEDVDLQAILVEQIQLFLKLIPAFLALSAVLLAFIVQWLSYKILNRTDKKEYRFPPIRQIQMPMSILWLYLLVIIVSFLNLDPDSMMWVGVQNALIILEIILVIQGFSFIFFFSHYKKWSKAIPILSIVLTIVFPMFLLYFVRILGIIDIGLNLKARLQKKG